MYLPDSAVDNFIGEVKNHHKTDATNVYGDRFRIDVWTKETGDLVDKYTIDKSFFVSYEDGTIKDLTR
jgi:hypothetical protein